MDGDGGGEGRVVKICENEAESEVYMNYIYTC